MKSVLKNVSVLGALVFVVYIVANYAGSAQTRLLSLMNLPETSVKGISTDRAQDIGDKFKSDVESQLNILEEQALNFTLGDAITTVSRLQRIPQDFHSIQEYTSQQIENFTKKK